MPCPSARGSEVPMSHNIMLSLPQLLPLEWDFATFQLWWRLGAFTKAWTRHCKACSTFAVLGEKLCDVLLEGCALCHFFWLLWELASCKVFLGNFTEAKRCGAKPSVPRLHGSDWAEPGVCHVPPPSMVPRTHAPQAPPTICLCLWSFLHCTKWGGIHEWKRRLTGENRRTVLE